MQSERLRKRTLRRRFGAVAILIALAAAGSSWVPGRHARRRPFTGHPQKSPKCRGRRGSGHRHRTVHPLPAIVDSSFSDADPSGSGVAAAKAAAAANGFPDGGNSTVVVNLPPESGPFKNKAGYAEVIVTFNQPRYLSRMWGGESIPVVARAVSRAGEHEHRDHGAESTVKNALIGSHLEPAT